jgi:hypothetical protein
MKRATPDWSLAPTKETIAMKVRITLGAFALALAPS